LFHARRQTYNRAKLTPEAPSSQADSNGRTFVPVIAIDGPVASGKSAVGRKVAERLGGYGFVDTGMMYRAVTWLALQRGLDLHDEASLSELAASVTVELERGPDGRPILILNGEDVTPHLRDYPIDHNVPFVSEVRGVRQAMVPHQRAVAALGRLVMVGRDIGSEVLKDAPLKVFLSASPEVRAARRHAEMSAGGVQRNLAEVLEEVRERDYVDENRAVSPLLNPRRDVLPEGTLLIETDNLEEDEVVERIFQAAQITG
jgi:CMP/dCMP kinase